MVRIYCKNTGTTKDFQEGTNLLEIADDFEFEKPLRILSAKVNNVSQGLKYKVYNSRDVEFLDYASYSGRNVYCRSLCFVLAKASQDIFPGSRITMRRPVSKGYFCEIRKSDGTTLSTGDVDAIRERMRAIIKADTPFYRHEVRLEDALKLFSEKGFEDKVKLLETTGDSYLVYYTLGDYADYFYEALVPSAGYLDVWALEPYRGGMLLRVPNRHSPSELAPFIDQPKTFDVFNESNRWNHYMDLSNVGDVNAAILAGRARELIQVSEALQEKKIVQIAEDISSRFFGEQKVRVVLITGPSSSGKSTVCRRLSIQLMACGLHPVFFSTDDYFVNRVETPLLPDGNYDFDNFDTVDHDALQADVVKLLGGEEVSVPEYNFVTGLREYNGKRLRLGERSVLLIEGLHALNPRLTDLIPESCKYRVFINTVTSLSLDDHNCIPTSDNRLLRRIVRDYNKGAFTAVETISNWPNVRRAEVKYIYPYQESADVLFNSTYLVEFAVLRGRAEQILSTVPKNCPEYSEAAKLLNLLHYFVPVSERDIPSTSLLREFVGGRI